MHTPSDDAERSDEVSPPTVQFEVSPRHQGGWALEVQDDESVRRVRVTEAAIVFGASPSADVVLRDRTVSARHCAVRSSGDGVSIRDLDSTNGTFVGGARIREAWGTTGTTITVGRSTLVCVPEEVDEDVELADPLPTLAGSSRGMRRVAAEVKRLSILSAPVLVTGETGAGKELVARALHSEGPRAGSPFVAINVAALPRELVESELFGHERGAFTGAVARRAGAFTEAEGGTLFLDEIGELPLDAQPKLLRALDGYEVRRVGAAGSGRRANVRVVAATHVSLADAVTRGAFRRDLFHRLEVFVIELPPLRERPGDVPPIARALLAQMEVELGRRELSPAAIARLTAHEWPGNVRELRNVLQRAAAFARGRVIDAGAVERGLLLRRGEARRAIAAMTPESAKEWLRRCHGNVSAAARAAGVPRTSFRKLLGT